MMQRTTHAVTPPGSKKIPQNFGHNFAIIDALTEIAKRKNITTTQLCIGRVSSLGPHVIPLPGSSRTERTLENCSGGDVTFTEAEL